MEHYAASSGTTDVPGHRFGPIFKAKEVKEEVL
jgi:hypothetical protein